MGDDKKTGKILKFECNLLESQICVQSTQHERAPRSHLRPGSRARLRALEALGILDALWWSLMHFWHLFFQVEVSYSGKIFPFFEQKIILGLMENTECKIVHYFWFLLIAISD